jgi:hypothetical protein
MNKSNIFTSFLLLVFLISCKKQQNDTGGSKEPSKEKIHGTGNILLDPQEYQKLIQLDKIKPAKATACPSVDLTSSFPTPADQGVQAAANAFVYGYYIKSYSEHVENGWSLNSPDHLISPQYIYSQTHISNSSGGGGDQASSVLNLLNNRGASTLDVSPYDPGNAFGFLTQPTEQEHMVAFRFHNYSYSALPLRAVDIIKNYLCLGYPIGISIPVYPDLLNLNSTNEIYDDLSGTLSSNHAVALIGFDDTKQAFKFINSWGTSWGLGGYGWISYNLVANNDFQNYLPVDDFDPALSDNYASTSAAGIGTLGYYGGDVNGDGNSDVIHPWNNNGTLAILAHDITGSPTSYLVSQTMSGAGANNVGFVPADVDGDGKTDLVQGWRSGNNLALTVFRSNGSSFSRFWDGTTVSGYQNIRLLPVDYDGDGKTDIAQLWNNNGQLGIVVFRSTGTSYTLAFSTTVGSGSGNVGFVPADYDGDGKTDIVQTWNDNGRLGVIVIRSSGSGYSIVWTHTFEDPAANVGFVPVDFDGDNKTDFVQGWIAGNPFQSLGYTLYRSTGTGYALQESKVTRQGYQNLGLLPQKRAGNPKTGFTQVWNNNQKTSFIRYDRIVY